MDLDGLPETAFVSPRGGNRDAVEALLQRGLGRVIAQLAGAAARPPLPREDRPLPELLPAEPVAEAEVLARLEGLLEASMNPFSPGWTGHMDPPPATASILGALAAAAINNNLLSYEMAPALSRLEVALMAELAGLFELPGGAGGVMASGGSLANTLALAVARNRAFPEVAERGLGGLARPPVFFASSAAHTSLAKAAMVLGLGRAAAIAVPCREGRMEPRALVAAVVTARAAGQAPFAVVATAGTTVTGAIDPLAAIAEVAAGEGLWLHVDAAYGGALAFSPRYRDCLAGIERADSVTFNPQKWLYVTKTCACCLFRDAALPAEHFRVAAPYMAETGGPVNLGELGLQGTRPAEVLKLWLTLQHFGRSGLARLIDAGMALTAEVAAELARRSGLELAAPADSNLLCFRPAGAEDAVVEALQQRLLDAGIFLSLPLYEGRRWLRLVLLNPHTGAAEVRKIFEVLDEGVGALDHGHPSTGSG
ncbi:MAG: pyridoxal-dependent decarboxylase [Kiloniellales bacterium]|nr:pyridoxal-dependent decarboxylase [Kiloniellales bacterium]